MFATFISDFGSGLTISILPVYFLQNGIKEGIGIYNGLDALGAPIGAIWIMSFIDRFKKNYIIALADVLRGLALLPLVFSSSTSMLGIVSYAILQSIFGAATISAVQSWIGECIEDKKDFKKANSIIETSSQIARTIAPLIGVIILTKYSIKLVFIIDAATYFIGSFITITMKSPKPTIKGNTSFKELKEGFIYCMQNNSIQRWIVISCLQFVGLAIMNTVYLSILDDQISSSDQQIAFFQTAYFLGALIGSSHGLFSTKAPIHILRWSSLTLAALMVISIFNKSYWIFFVVGILQRAATLVSAISTRSLCQQDAHPNFIGRVMAFRWAIINGSGVLLYIITISIFGKISIPILLTVAACSFVAAGVISRQND